MFLIDYHMAGRKGTLRLSFLLSAVLLGMFAASEGTSIWLSFMARFMMKLCFQMIYPFTTETFGTLNRTLGFGFCSAQGRLSNVFMPVVIFGLLGLSERHLGNKHSLPFLLMAGMALCGAVATHLVPRDTTGCDLDQPSEQATSMISEMRGIH